MPRSVYLALLLDVWREVGRHLEITEFIEAVAPRIAAHLPFRELALVRLDPMRGLGESVAIWRPPPSGPPDLPSVRDPAVVQGALADLKAGRRGPQVEGLLKRLGQGISSDTWFARIEPEPEEGAEVILLLAGLRALDAETMLRDLLEPFAAALANDRRVHELARLREAVEAENRALLSRLERQDISDTIVGAQRGLRGVMRRVDQVASTDAPVLILGETGAGKEVVARAVHERSRRSKGPFLRVNCGAIPQELIDSELFGHEKGSFTGAIADRPGWFERADGGTLFLDELGELPPAAQVRLLRVLQDGTFERVGGRRTLRADVRVIAATHRDMKQLLKDGRFREDLWYRVAVFPIDLPSLRDRPEDIPELAHHFATRAGRRLHGKPLAPDEEDLRLLLAYPWPGNVREFAAVIERAAILGDGRQLDVARALGPQGASVRGAPIPDRSAPPHPKSLEEANRAAIEEALREAHGQIQGPGGAAERLRINPSTLRSRMERLGIDWRPYKDTITSADAG